MNDFDDLTLYGLEFGTDKAFWHRYTPTYYNYFEKIRYSKNTILEIGIGSENAPSIKMLSKFFNNSNIYTIDIHNSYVREANKVNNVKSIVCDSSNKDDLLNNFGNTKFDLIIDDASHIESHQINAFECLFPLLNENGIYICEDVHPSGNINNNRMIDYFNNYSLKNAFKSIEVFHRSKKALQCCSCRKPNINNLNTCSCGVSMVPNNNDSISIIVVKK